MTASVTVNSTKCPIRPPPPTNMRSLYNLWHTYVSCITHLVEFQIIVFQSLKIRICQLQFLQGL